jgi:arsenite-transporting ATPase
MTGEEKRMGSDYHGPGPNKGQVTMFAGKGGVGKTTCAAATALHYASLKEETLIISTDPTPSLSHIFELKGEQKRARIRESLDSAELGLDEIREMWDKKFGQEVYEVFSSFVSVGYEEFVDFITSILPGLSDEFMVDYIRELSRGNEYKRIVWDTAPLGQTLGLLETPTMLRKHLKPAPRIYSKLKLGAKSKRSVLDILKGWERLSAGDMDFLRNEVGFVIVTIPEALAVEQLEFTFGEFDRYGFRVDELIINNVINETDSPFLHAKAKQQRGYIELLRDRYGEMKIVELPLFPYEIKGMERLQDIGKSLFG